MGRKKSVAGQNRDSPRSTAKRPPQDNANSVSNDAESQTDFESNDSDLTQRLIRLRGEASRKTFADRIGIVEGSYRQWETGVRQPSWQALAQIAEATGCDPAWLLTGRGSMFPAESADSEAGREAARQMAAAALDSPKLLADLEARLARFLRILGERRRQLG